MTANDASLSITYGIRRGLVYLMSEDASRVLARGQARIDVSDRWKGTISITAVAEPNPSDPLRPRYDSPEPVSTLSDGAYAIRFLMCSDQVLRGSLAFRTGTLAEVHAIDLGPIEPKVEAGTGEFHARFEVWDCGPRYSGDDGALSSGDWIFLIEQDEVIGTFGPVSPYRLTPQNPELWTQPDPLLFGEIDFDMDSPAILAEANEVRRTAGRNTSTWALRYVLDDGLIAHLRSRIADRSITATVRRAFGLG